LPQKHFATGVAGAISRSRCGAGTKPNRGLETAPTKTLRHRSCRSDLQIAMQNPIKAQSRSGDRSHKNTSPPELQERSPDRDAEPDRRPNRGLETAPTKTLRHRSCRSDLQVANRLPPAAEELAQHLGRLRSQHAAGDFAA